MEPLSKEVIQQFTNICHGYQLNSVNVLQAFADKITVHGYLYPDHNSPSYFASQIFSLFFQCYKPVYPLDFAKRDRGIRNIRKILKVMQSFMSDQQKEKICQAIIDEWIFANRLHCQVIQYPLSAKAHISLSQHLLLQCDLFRCRPTDLLSFFMELTVYDAIENNCDEAAIQFVLYCAGQTYQIGNN